MKFQSTHPRGVRLGSAFFVVKGFLVSIHAPAWGATPVLAKTSKSCPCFNPRTRVGCDLRTDREQRPVFICFNPRTRVGCDCQKAATHPVDEVVSIHAPAWGATMRTNRYRRFFEVSIHAPAWGATRNIRGNHLALVGFNPRTRVGCDARSRRSTANAMRFQSTHPRGVRRFRGWGRRRGHHVSIHAPAWGATAVENAVRQTLRVSIHAPAWGATEHRALYGSRYVVSIHAPAWGATRLSMKQITDIKRFQSTHPRGVRLDKVRIKRGFIGVSIHAPAWGATVHFLQSGSLYTWFQSTHPRGVRLEIFPAFSARESFQSTHPRGVRPVFCWDWPCCWRFNPRTRVGCDRCQVSLSTMPGLFQSTHPRGVRLFPCFIQ